MEYKVYKYKLVWLYDENVKDVSKIESNNLFALDEKGNRVWEMNSLAPANDCCVSLEIIDDNSFKFITFFGMSYIYDLKENKVINKNIAK